MTIKTQHGPALGTVISGAMLLEYTHQHDGGGGMYPHGVGIFFASENPYYHFVVWTIYTEDGEKWIAENGSYCTSLSGAIHHYKSRGGTL